MDKNDPLYIYHMKRNAERKKQEEAWAKMGLKRPYWYDKPIELGGRCFECDRTDGYHYHWCGAVD